MKGRLLVLTLLCAFLAVAAADRSNGDAGDGFYYRGIAFKPFHGETIEVTGEMTNRSDKDYASVMFDLTLYNLRDDIIAVDHFIINNFRNGDSRPLQALVNVKLADIWAYKIDYSSGFEKR